MPFVELRTTRKSAHVDLELRVIQELSVSVNRVSVKVQMIVEKELNVMLMFADSSVMVTRVVSITKNVPTVFVHPHVKLMNLVLLVSSVIQVNVKLAADPITNVHFPRLV